MRIYLGWEVSTEKWDRYPPKPGHGGSQSLGWEKSELRRRYFGNF